MAKTKSVLGYIILGVVMIIASLTLQMHTPHQKNNPYHGFVESCG